MSRRDPLLRLTGRLLVAAAVLCLAACSGGDGAGPSGPSQPPAPTTGALTVDITGLPASVSASLRLVGPGGDRTLTASGTVSGLTPGDYTLTATPITAPNGAFAPDTATRTTTVRAGSAATLRVRYDITTGAIALAATGLPPGARTRVLLAAVTDAGTAPARDVGDSTTITHLTPGRYLVRAAAARSDSAGTWVPVVDTATLLVSASLDPARVSVTYAPLRSRLAIAIGGLPANAEASILLRGPGVARPVVQSLRLDSVARGTYELEIGTVRASGFTFRPDSARRTISVLAGDSATLAVQYGLGSGAIAMQVSGVPEPFPANVRVIGPDSVLRRVGITSTLTDLPLGEYLIEADTTHTPIGRYIPVTAPQRVRVTASMVGVPVRVQYRGVPGRLLLSLVNVPAGSTPTIVLTGLEGWQRTVTQGGEVTEVPAGAVRIAAGEVQSAGDLWRPTVPAQELFVSPGATVNATVTYAMATGRMQLTPNGLPGGTSARITIAGANGATRTLDVAAPMLVTGLEPGSYTVTAPNLPDASPPLFPLEGAQIVTVTRGATTPVSISWQPQSALNNLTVAGAYITQAAQRFDGSVPLVANREAMLRVFVRAARTNSWRPTVRVRLYDGTTLLQTTTIPAPEGSVRTTIDESILGTSWNLPIPASLMRPTLRLLVDADPTNAIPESDDGDNVWPRLGQPQAIDVRAVPTLTVQFISIVNGGRAGNVSTANVEQFLAMTRQAFPIGTVNVTVRPTPFTSSAPVLDADDDNGSWSTMLREVDALRVVEAMPTMYYHGIVRLTYGSGIAGVAFRPGRAGLSYDVLGNGGAPLVVAHELGHNFNRDHAPCGVTGDREFPHVNGAIGVVGLNLSTLQIFAPTRPDLMSYCSNGWVSDWNWTQILRYRATADAVAGSQMAATTAEAPARQRVLLVWGHADERAVHLEPAFALEGMPTAPQPGGTFHVEGRDATGAVLFSQAFAAQEIPDLPAKPESHFALAVPLPATIESRLASLTVVRARDGRAATMRTSATGAQANIVSTVEVARAAGGTLAVRHDRAAARMALVRDAASGQILGFVRNGDAALQAPRGDVEVLLSDGVRTRRAQVRPALR